MEQNEAPYTYDIKIGVIGVGGAGGNLVQHIWSSLKDARVNLLAINTDASALKQLTVATLTIGAELTHGLGAGADPEVGRLAAESDRERISASIAGLDIVFVVGGMGGGTGTGALPVVADIARTAGALCIALVSTPFEMEGAKRKRVADAGVAELLKRADSVCVHENQDMLRQLGSQVTLLDAFKAANQRLAEIIRSVVAIYRTPGLITVDLQDLRLIFAESGRAAVGIGHGTGSNRATDAARAALHNLGSADALQKASGVMVIIRGLDDLRTSEFSIIGDVVKNSLPDDASMILSSWIDSSVEDELMVTVIATGVDPAGTGRPQTLAARLLHSSYGTATKPIYLLAADTIGHREIAELVEHLSALYRSVGGDELVVTDIDHVTPLTGSTAAVRSKQLRRTG